MKDRTGLNGFTVAILACALSGLLEKGLLADALLGQPPTGWPKEWSSLDRFERITWGRIVALAHRGADLTPAPDQLLWDVIAAS